MDKLRVEAYLTRKRRERKPPRIEKQESSYDRARNELFGAIRQCGVIGAHEDDQAEWMIETIDLLGQRYPDLTQTEREQLHAIGIRFCQPVIPHGTQAITASLEDANAA